MSDTPFVPPADDALEPGGSRVPEPVPADQLPSAVDIVSDSFKVFMDDIGPFALAGLGVFVAAIVAVVVVMTLAFGCMFAGFFGSMAIATGGAATGSDGAAAAGGLVSGLGILVTYLGSLLLMVVGIAVTTAPLNGSLLRAMDAHLRGGRKVGFGSAFETAFQQPVKDILSTIGLSAAIFVGILVFYVGALFSVFFFSWWPTYVMVDGAGVGEGAGKAFSHAKDNLGWHLGVFGLGLAIGLVANYIPVVGPMFAAVYHLKAYRAAYPAGTAADPDILV